MKADQFRQTGEELESFNGYVLASTWLQCSPAEGVGGPFTKSGGRSNLGSDKDDSAAWNADIDAGILWWLEFDRDAYDYASARSTASPLAYPSTRVSSR